MAQMTTSFYATLADAFHNSRVQMNEVDDYIETAVNTVVNLTTGDEGAVDIEVALLTPVYAALRTTQNTVASTTPLLPAVRAINDYVINHSSGTATVDYLSDFIDSVISNEDWDFVPAYWIELSTDAGYATSSWPAGS